jgi:hypothetical protein
MARVWSLGAVFLCALAPLCLAQAAAGAMVSVVVGTDEAILSYQADAGERNSLSIRNDLAPVRTSVSVEDRVAVTPGPGCEAPPGGGPGPVTCSVPEGLPLQIRARLGDGDDRAGLGSAFDATATVAGGPGNDSIHGPGNEHAGGVPEWLGISRSALRLARPGCRKLSQRARLSSGEPEPTRSSVAGAPIGSSRVPVQTTWLAGAEMTASTPETTPPITLSATRAGIG